MKGVIRIATIEKITVPANVATAIVNGDGRKVLVQGGTYFIGGADVDSDNGLFISGGHEFIDLGNVAIGETIYAFSTDENVITVFYYTTNFN